MNWAYIGKARNTRMAKMDSAIISSIRVKPDVRTFMFSRQLQEPSLRVAQQVKGPVAQPGSEIVLVLALL